MTLSSSTVAENRAAGGGGVTWNGISQIGFPTISNSIVYDNISSSGVPGISYQGNASPQNSVIVSSSVEGVTPDPVNSVDDIEPEFRTATGGLVQAATYDPFTGVTVVNGNFPNPTTQPLVGSAVVFNPGNTNVEATLVLGHAGSQEIVVLGALNQAVTAGDVCSFPDYRLRPSSPLIDAGDLSLLPLDDLDLDDDEDTGEVISLDLVGALRVIDSQVDMGARETFFDCNGNNISDRVEVSGNADDCNSNFVPDACELSFNDCDRNNILDDCQPDDCNGNGQDDFAEVIADPSLDCNLNGVPDACDIADQASTDCDQNGIPDECTNQFRDINDCNGNGVPDECESDCNCNGTDDVEDLGSGSSLDANQNGVPDECDPEPLPTYEIGTIPDQDVWGDNSLLFFVTPPANLPGAELLAPILSGPLPLGEISFVDGLFTFSPDTSDKQTFGVTFLASDGETEINQVVLVSPNRILPAEADSFGITPSASALPDASGREYVIRSEVLSDAPEYFNLALRTTRSISIAGKTVVIEQGHPNGIYDSYHLNNDIAIFRIDAETIVVRSELHLPQSRLVLNARELRFEDQPGNIGSAKFVTTPDSFLLPAGNIGEDGEDGAEAGDLELAIKKLTIFPGDACDSARFVLRGGAGQEGGPGQDGGDGLDRVEVPSTCGPVGLNGEVIPEGTVYLFVGPPDQNNQCADLIGNFSCGAQIWPGDGNPASPGGQPGEGGRGGFVFSSTDVGQQLFDLSGGSAGDMPPVALGGEGGSPRAASWRFYVCQGPSNPALNNITETRMSQDGADAPAPPPENPFGPSGAIFEDSAKFSWLKPAALRMVVAHARDSYRSGFDAEVEAILSNYFWILQDYQESSEWASVGREDQAELLQLENEITAILHRIENKLDYFGNPAGWVPMLSFEFTRFLYDQEIDRAISAIYLATWIRESNATLQAKVTALTNERMALRAERDFLVSEFDDANQRVPELQTTAANLATRVEEIEIEISLREAQLLATAQNNIKVPFWKKALRVIGQVASFIPYGQPFLGKVGSGLEKITNIDFNAPLSGIFDQARSVAEEFRDLDFSGAVQEWKGVVDDISSISDPQDAIDVLQDNWKPVSESYRNIASVIDNTGIESERLSQELAKLKAQDPIFNDLIRKAESLAEDQNQLATELAEIMQRLTTLANEITRNTIAIDGLNRDISDGNAVINDRVVQQLDELERRARDRLLRYQYYMRKAYEYRFLEPLPSDIELNLNTLLDEMVALATTTQEAQLTPEQFSAFKSIYEDQLAAVTDRIVNDYLFNAPSRETGVRFSLTDEELARLNNNETIAINLTNRGIFFPDEEDIRLVEISVANITTEFAGPVPTSSALLDIDFEHSGVSIVEIDGDPVKFRHFTDRTENPLIWSARYDALDDLLEQQTVSEADESLLISLISPDGAPPPSETILLFSRPGANADILISKSPGLTDNGTDIKLTSLRVEVDFDFRTRSSVLKRLTVAPSDPEIKPYISVDTADINSRLDGRGQFRRTYNQGQTVLLTAEPQYGRWVFEKWTDAFGNDLDPPATDPTLEVLIDTDRGVRAVYQPPCVKDFNRDGLVNANDIEAFIEIIQIGSTEPSFTCGADGDGDGVVTVDDIPFFVTELLGN